LLGVFFFEVVEMPGAWVQGVHHILTPSKKCNYAFKKVIVDAWNLNTAFLIASSWEEIIILWKEATAAMTALVYFYT
jgi:hypothetical protein